MGWRMRSGRQLLKCVKLRPIICMRLFSLCCGYQFGLCFEANVSVRSLIIYIHWYGLLLIHIFDVIPLRSILKLVGLNEPCDHLYHKIVDPCVWTELAPVLEGSVAADTAGKERPSTVLMSNSLPAQIVGLKRRVPLARTPHCLSVTDAYTVQPAKHTYGVH